MSLIVVLMGVAGSGKTTIGRMLASAMQCPFLEGDALHSRENVDKMSRGIALTDADRGEWLAAIRVRIVDAFERGQDLVVGCSALGRSSSTYRPRPRRSSNASCRSCAPLPNHIPASDVRGDIVNDEPGRDTG